MNFGNTGHRYRMPQIISVRDEDRHVVLNLGCGHEKVIAVSDRAEGWSFDLRAFWHDQVAKRERCYECKSNG